jgi:predicted dehydrogenase
MRIGVIDLDTSHPAAFLPLLRARGHDVVAVFGGNTVVDDDWTHRYAAEHGIGQVVNDPGELFGIVDAVFVHSVNWDVHLERARQFAARGVPVHICKPFAGNAADLRELVALAAGGARISGGSALRWCAAVADWKNAAWPADTAFVVTYGHPLDYGIHAYALVHGLFGPGIEAARALDLQARRVELRWSDGRTALVAVPPSGDAYGFFATIAGPTGVHHLDAGGSDLYSRFIDVTLEHLTASDGGTLSLNELVEPDLAAVAGLASAHHDGRWIGLHDDARIDSVSYDGAAFAAEYRKTRRAALGLAV